jgi:hypothetical protein
LQIREKILEILPENPEDGLTLGQICDKIGTYSGEVSQRLWSLRRWKAVDYSKRRGLRTWWRIEGK